MAVLRQGFAKLTRRRRGVGEGRGCALDVVLLPSHPPLFIGARERGAGPLQMDLEGGGGQGGGLPPKPRGAPPPGFPPTLGAWALGGGAKPTWGWFPSTHSP